VSSDDDVIIVGAGAAGLFCGIHAVRRGKRVVILEHADRPGKKILISGGGRCNFTNVHCRAENFLSENPHFAKSALARFGPEDFVALVEKHKLPYHEKKLGQLFCDRHAVDILDMLIAEQPGRLVLNCRVEAVRRSTDFVVETSQREFRAPVLVVACGGLSIPKIGATGLAYSLAAQFGLSVVPPRPALVPLTFCAKDLARFRELSGVSTPVIASFGHARFEEKMLFTHRGLSGPAILQISSYWDGRGPVAIDLAPGVDLAGELEQRKRAGERIELKTALAAYLPARLADRLSPAWSLTQASVKDLRSLGDSLHRWMFTPCGTEGFEKAEVTAGGVSTGELSAKTLECRNVPGLFFIGEAVDVTGHLGGFNFQWAWASGFAAGQAV
jgi:predicted Rossmann fold flavoprotein